MTLKKLLGVFALVLSIFIMGIAHPVYACSPAPGAFDYTLKDRVEAAPIIAIGTVIGGELRGSGQWKTIETAQIEVETYLKGTGAKVIRVEDFGDGADCLSIVNIDTRGIFFIEGDATMGYRASYVAVGDAVYNASEENITDIGAITGTQNSPSALSFIEQVQYISSQYTEWVIALSILAVVLVLSPFIWQGVRNPRKRKAKRS